MEGWQGKGMDLEETGPFRHMPCRAAIVGCLMWGTPYLAELSFLICEMGALGLLALVGSR